MSKPTATTPAPTPASATTPAVTKDAKTQPTTATATPTVKPAAPVTSSLVDTKSAVVTRYGPGLCLIKNALSMESQKWLAAYAMRMGNDTKVGFWNISSDGKEKTLN